MPEGKTIIVKDQTDASTVYINIPAEQKMDDVELNEEQLEAVAGGRGKLGCVLPQDPLGNGGVVTHLPPNGGDVDVTIDLNPFKG